MAGIRLQERTTRVWNKAGVCPEEIAELSPQVWSPEDVKILGTPVGPRGVCGQGGGRTIGGGTEVVGRVALGP